MSTLLRFITVFELALFTLPVISIAQTDGLTPIPTLFPADTEPIGGRGMVGSDVPGAPCTLVELQPGYPGYRGFVTGLLGPGEAACRETLVVTYTWFDPAEEDAANVAAGQRLGITGPRSTWVWENWLAIEAERNLPRSCYMEAHQAIASGSLFVRMDVASNDPRLLAGNIDSTEMLARLSVEADVPFWAAQRVFPTDYQLRSFAWAYSGKEQPNEVELEATSFAIMQQINQSVGAPSDLLELIIQQGGYAPVPADACPADQWFIAATTFFTLVPSQSGAIVSSLFGQLENSAKTWMNDRAEGSDQSFREFLIENSVFLP